MPKAPRNLMLEYEEIIRTAMARTLWVSSYADYVEESKDEDLPRARNGQDWEDVAPETPSSAFEAAKSLIAQIAKVESINDPYPMAELFSHAMEADTGKPWSWPTDVRRAGKAIALMKEFGSDIAMQSMGTGVSWFDDHAEFELQLPRFECHYSGGDDLYWSGAMTNPAELEEEGPTEDDYVTTDYRDWYQYDKHVLTVPDDNWRVAVELHMAKENFWPNVWFISDHGNAQMLSLAYDNGKRNPGPASSTPLVRNTRVSITAPGDDTDVVGVGVVKYFKNGWYGIQLDGEKPVYEYPPERVFELTDNPASHHPWSTVAVVSADRTRDADTMSTDLAREIERTFGIVTMREATYPLWRVFGKGDTKTIAKVRTFAHSWLSADGVAATRPNPRSQR